LMRHSFSPKPGAAGVPMASETMATAKPSS
jgi:hypothetical protein